MRSLQEETGVDPEFIRTGLLILDPEEQAQALDWARTHDTSIEILESAGLQETEPGLGPQPPNALWMPRSRR